jgi:hypothetical protein
MLECRKIRNQISQYIDNELDEKNIDMFEKHINSCKECRKELQEMLSIIGILQSTEDQDLPEGFRIDLHNRLIGESGKPSDKKHIIRNFGKYVAILSSAAAVLLIAFLFRGVWSNILDNGSVSDVSPITLSGTQDNVEKKMSYNYGQDWNVQHNDEAYNGTETQIDSSEQGDIERNMMINYDTQPTGKKEDVSDAVVSEEPVGYGAQATANNDDNLIAANAATAEPSAKSTRGAGAPDDSTGEALFGNVITNRNTSEVIVSGTGGDQTENIRRLAADCGGEVLATTVTTTLATKSVGSDSAEKVVTVKVKNSQYSTLVEQLKANYGSENLIITEVNHEDTSIKVNELNTTLKNLDSKIDESKRNGASPDSRELQELNNQRAAVTKEIEAVINDSEYTYINITIKNIKQ